MKDSKLKENSLKVKNMGILDTSSVDWGTCHVTMCSMYVCMNVCMCVYMTYTYTPRPVLYGYLYTLFFFISISVSCLEL